MISAMQTLSKVSRNENMTPQLTDFHISIYSKPRLQKCCQCSYPKPKVISTSHYTRQSQEYQIKHLKTSLAEM